MKNTRPNENRVNLKALAVLERRGLGQLDDGFRVEGLVIESRRVFIMNTIPPQGIGAVILICDGMAPILCGSRIHDEYSSE